MKPQEGIGCPSAPLRRGQDGLAFWLQGTMLSVAPVSTKYLSFVNFSVRKINPALAGICIAVACVGLAAKPKVARRQASFLTKHRAEPTCEPYGRNNCEICTRHCQGFERNKSPGGKGSNFWSGALRLLLSPLFPLVGAGLLLRFVEVAATVGSWLPRASHRAFSAFTPWLQPSCASSYCFSHRWWKLDQKHWKKKIIVRQDSWREMLFELFHENTGFEALHFYEKAK